MKIGLCECLYACVVVCVCVCLCVSGCERCVQVCFVWVCMSRCVAFGPVHEHT